MSLIKRLTVTAAAVVLAAPLVAVPAAATTRTFVCAQGRMESGEPLFHFLWLTGEGCTGPTTPMNGPGVITITPWGQSYDCAAVSVFNDSSVFANAKNCVWL
ncbi:hypothetical protein ACFYY8_41935 [Streptosporangium sp. NPDC001559]|uniref:hypothetical protein n=1 Tax=Streptosporangium sp. NPDC001559 TaxID=3366187 RepID=UPI0036ECE062